MSSAMSSFVSEHIDELKNNPNKGFAVIGLELERVKHKEKLVSTLLYLLPNSATFHITTIFMINCT